MEFVIGRFALVDVGLQLLMPDSKPGLRRSWLGTPVGVGWYSVGVIVGVGEGVVVKTAVGEGVGIGVIVIVGDGC